MLRSTIIDLSYSRLQSRHPSFYAYNEGLVLTNTDIDYVTQYYATYHNVELDDPIISPTYGNLKKNPPAL